MAAKLTRIHNIANGETFVLRDSKEIAPGVFAGGIPPEAIPRRGWISWVRRPDGAYYPVAKTLGPTIRLTRDIGKKLGVALEEDGSRGAPESMYHICRRLMIAGLVTGKPVLQNTWRMDLESFWRFWDALDGSYWTPARRQLMKESRYDSTRETP